MEKKQFPKPDPDKWLKHDLIRLNLQLVSLYLTAYEIMKFGIIDSVAFEFVTQEPISEEAAAQWIEVLGAEGARLVENAKRTYEEQVNEYKSSMKIDYEERDYRGLMPSAQYLLKIEALEKRDVEDLRLLREHRNRLAHELPRFMFNQNYDVKIEYLLRIREIVDKVNVYWIRIYNDVPEHIPDDNIFPGPLMAIDALLSAVMEDLDQRSKS